MGAAWSNRVVQLPFRSGGGGALFDPGRFASGRFHGKNGSRSAGAWPPAAAQACMYSVSHDRGLIPHDDEDQPAGFIGLMKGRLPVPCDQGLVEADEQWLQPMQALGLRARRQVQPQPPPGLEQPFGRPLGGELVVQDLDPDRGAKPPLGDQFGHGRRGDRPRPRTATGPLIAPSSNQPPIGLDFDLHLFRHFRDTGGQGSSAGRACTLQLGQYPGFFADRQMAIIAAFGPGRSCR